MQDSIIKGTGNSRKLKSVANFLSAYPTYAAFAAALVAGTLPVDFNGINADGFDVVGTPLNKATLFTDETAALMGLSGDNATPNKAFEWLMTQGTRMMVADSDLGGSRVVKSIPEVSVAAGVTADLYQFKALYGGTVNISLRREATATGTSGNSIVKVYVNGTNSQTQNLSNGASAQTLTITQEVSLGDVVRIEYENTITGISVTHVFSSQSANTISAYIVENPDCYFGEVE